MKIIDATDQKKWDKFITSHEDANFLQSWAWGVFHEARGKKVIRRIALDNDENIIAAYVAGARFFELKTVQIMDGEELSAMWFMGSQGVGHDWATELNWTKYIMNWTEYIMK